MRPPARIGSGSNTSLSWTIIPATDCGPWPVSSCLTCEVISAWSSARKESLNLPNDLAAMQTTISDFSSTVVEVNAPDVKPSSEFVLAMSMTRRASRSFGFTMFKALESLIASVCVNSSSFGELDAIYNLGYTSQERAQRYDGSVRWWWSETKDGVQAAA